jgi:chlorite dismutase
MLKGNPYSFLVQNIVNAYVKFYPMSKASDWGTCTYGKREFTMKLLGKSLACMSGIMAWI